MATITEDYVSFETALLLKKKGFEQHKCQHSYNSKGVFKWSDDLDPYEYSAPTLQMAMKWLREVYNIYLNINVRVILGQWAGYDISVYTTDNDGFLNKNIPIKLKDNISYEQAIEAGIKYALENLI